MNYIEKILTYSILLLTCSTANSALVSRLNGLAFYDTEADLTWLADANALAGTVYDSNWSYGSSTDGATLWSRAKTWADNLEIDGVSGWRLPTADASCGASNCFNSEMGNLFYNVFDGVSVTAASQNDNYKLFSNIASTSYWSSTGYLNTRAFTFVFTTGNQNTSWESKEHRAWAVHSGDVATVPLPAAFWLFCTGLIGLISFSRRDKS